MKNRIISPVVVTLSMVSLFTDLASEMLYPVVPVYLQSIGFSIIIIGILAGSLADKIGLKRILLIGVLLFSVVYFSMAFCDRLWQFLVVCTLYGGYSAGTEGVSKARISHLVPYKETARLWYISWFAKYCCTICKYAGRYWLEFYFSGRPIYYQRFYWHGSIF